MGKKAVMQRLTKVILLCCILIQNFHQKKVNEAYTDSQEHFLHNIDLHNLVNRCTSFNFPRDNENK